MKYIFEEKDIQAGLYVIRQSSPKGSKDLMFASTVCYKVAYTNNNTEKPYGLCNFTTDGWYYPIGDKKAICDHLNNDRDGFRPLQKEELIEILQNSLTGFLKL